MLRLIECTRGQIIHILRSLAPGDFQRKGHHAEDGPLTLEELLRRVTIHIPHHIEFIREKLAALGLK